MLPYIYGLKPTLHLTAMKVLFTIGCLLLSTIIFAQEKLVSTDTMYHYYKLSKEQQLYVQEKGTVKDTNWLFTNKVFTLPKMFAQALDTFANGCYIQAKVTDYYVQYSIVNKYGFVYNFNKLKGYTLLYLLTDNITVADRTIINTAKVMYNDSTLIYDEGFGAYILPNKLYANNKKFKNIIVDYATGITIIPLQVTPEPKVRRTNKKIKDNNIYGYSITDKPWYKHTDTLRYKAYYVNSKGKPITGAATIQIIDNNTGAAKAMFNLKHTTPGAYIWQWIVPDSLLTDRNYNIIFKHKVTAQSKYTTVMVKDYLLQKNVLTTTISNTNLKAKDSVVIHITTTDANGFGIENVRLKLQVNLLTINNLYQDSTLLTKQMQNVWYIVDTILPYNTKQQYVLPSSMFINGHATYQVTTTLIDDGLELQVNQYVIDVNKKPYEIIFVQKKDSLVINSFRNGNNSKENYIVKYYSINGKMLDSFAIQTPIKLALKPSYTTAQLFIKDSLVASIGCSYNNIALLEATGTRNARKFTYGFTTPLQQPVHYKIYKGMLQVLSGYSKQVNFTTADSSLDSYSILISNNINGDIYNNIYEYTFNALHKQLYITSTLPDEAFPGQSIPIELLVKDYKGNPVKDINLAYYAVNNQFGNAISEPYIDVPATYSVASTTVKQPNINYNIYAQILNQTASYNLTTAHILRYNLHQYKYYSLVYAKKGYGIAKLKKQQGFAEVAVIVASNHGMYIPKYVQINNQFSYVNGIVDANKYSTIVDAGTHTFTVRVFNKKIVLSNIKIDSFTKTIICINIDSIAILKQQSNITITDSLTYTDVTTAETQAIINHIVVLGNLPNNTIAVTNNIASKIQHHHFNNDLQVIKIGDDTYNALLPYPFTSINLMVGNKIFSAQAGKQLYYFNNMQDGFTTKEIKNEYKFLLQEKAVQINTLNYYQQPDTFTKPKEVVTQAVVTQYKQAPTPQIQIANYNYTPPINATDSNCFIQIINNGQPYITNTWLINNDKEEQSYYHIYGNNYMYATVNNNCTLHIFFSNGTMATMPNVKLHTGDKLVINVAYLKKDSISEKFINKAISLYNRLLAAPYTPFYNKPQEAQGLPTLPLAINNTASNAYIQGTVVNSSLQPIANAVVILEQQGRYIQGFITNTQGMVEGLHVKPGVYDVKVYNAYYNLKYYYGVNIGGAYAQSFSIVMDPLQNFYPAYESIHKYFYYKAYKIDSTKKSFTVHIYNSITRQVITKGKIICKQEGKADTSINIATYKQANGSIIIPASIMGTSLIVAIDSCNIMVFNNLPTTSLEHSLDVFINKATGNIEIYNLTQMQTRRKQNNNYLGYSGMYRDTVMLGGFNGVDSLVTYEWANNITEEEKYRNEEPNSMRGNNYGSNDALAAPSSNNIEMLGSNSYSNASAITSGTYTLKSIKGVRVAARRNNTTYMVDGKLVEKNEDATDAEEEDYATEPDGLEDKKDYKQKVPNKKPMMDNVLQSNLANQYRTYFTDVAFWLPNLITDASGKTYATITLPHNITQYRTFAVAMGSNFYYGQVDSTIKTYKPISTTNYVPRFLHKGDSATVKAKFTNLMGDVKPVELFFEVNNSSIKKYNTTLDKFITDSISVIAKDTTAIKYIAGLRYQNKYTDAEQSLITVIDPALTQYQHQALLLNKDSSYTITIPANTTSKLMLNNNLYEKIIQLTQELEQYDYGCVEQTSSKLKALVYQQALYNKLNKKFTNTKLIYKCIHKLEYMQNNNGSWGWWRNNDADVQMTAYALEALKIAEQYGYTNTAANEALNYLNKRLFTKKVKSQLDADDKLMVHYIVSKYSEPTITTKQLNEIDVNTLNNTNKIYYYKLCSMVGVPVPTQSIYTLALALQNNTNNNFINDDFFEDKNAAIFNFYTISKGTSMEQEVDKYFKANLLNGSLEKNLNTFSKAAFIEALFNTNQVANPSATVTVNGKKITTYPYYLALNNGTNTIEHNGAPVYAQVATTSTLYNPTKVDSVFSITTTLLQNNVAVSNLQKGITTTLQVDVNTYSTKKYVMITVPIPAGCIVQQSKNSNNNIEYRKDKIIIYQQQLAVGKQTWNFTLMPTYTGKYILPAAQVSSMYYPFINGNNADASISIQ